jgi:hypothetical protein
VSDEKSRLTFIEANPLSISRIERIERDLKSWAEKEISFSFDVTGTELFLIHELAHSYAKRSVDLADSIRTLLDHNRIVPATILGRALIETVAMGCLFLHDMDRFVASGERTRIEEKLKRYYAGVKGGPVDPVHVMDAMRHLEKIDGQYVEYLDSKYGFLALLKEAGIVPETAEPRKPRDVLSALKNYDDLSEVSHPNGTGTQFLYPATGTETPAVEQVRSRFRQLSVMAIWQCQHLLKALERSVDLPARYRAAFLK